MAGLAIVFGIIAIVFSWIPAFQWVGIPFGILGIVFGAVAKKKGSGAGTAGMVLSIIGTVLSAALYIACVACASAAGAL